MTALTKGLKHMRKAYTSKGDDSTLTRFIKIPGEHKKKNRQPHIPGLGRAYVEAGRSKFFRKGVHAPSDVKNVLVSGHSNVKIGRDVRKGHLRDYWIYTLTLEERATCPTSCSHWQTCYGNNMPWAKRVSHGVELLEALERELATLLAVRGRRGILIRLHALGDFYSEAYVGFWREMLARHDRLAIFGYTAHPPQSEIGRAVFRLMDSAPERCFIRFSNGGLPIESTVSIADPASCPPDAFVCPEQTGKTQCCATCGACWGTTKNVAFLEH